MRSHCGLIAAITALEGTLIAVGLQIQFQRLGLDERFVRHVVQDEMREIGLARDRTERREFGRCEAYEIGCIGMRVGNGIQHRRIRLRRNGDGAAEL
jgi:hypothetical protein